MIHFFYVLKGPAMGVTDFINPRDEEKPVFEVSVICPLSPSLFDKRKYHLYTHNFTRKIANLFADNQGNHWWRSTLQF